MDIKKWVRDARKSKGWNQTQLGEKLSRTKANVGHWETGKHKPSYAQLAQISQVTGYPLPPAGAPKPEPEGRVADSPPALSPRFEDTRTLDPEDWRLWQAFKEAATPEERKLIVARYELVERLAEEKMLALQEQIKKGEKP